MTLAVAACFPWGDRKSLGNSSVLRLTSASDFHPIHLPGVQAVGWPRDIASFSRALLEGERERWEEQRVSFDPTHAQIDIVAAMTAALDDAGRTKTIGG